MAWNNLNSCRVALALALVFNTGTPLRIQTGFQPELSLSYLTAHATPPNEPQFRLPPSFTDPPSSPPDWDSAPGDWHTGVWYMVASGSSAYQAWTNIQWHITPISLANQSAPSTQYQGFFVLDTDADGPQYFYGTDTPIAPNAYDWLPAGKFAAFRNTWEMLAWGYDGAGAAYAVVYESPSGPYPPLFDFISRSSRGIAADTYDMLLQGIRKLGSPVLDEALVKTKPMKHDRRHDGQPFPVCNVTCMRNEHFNYTLPPTEPARYTGAEQKEL